MISVGYMVRATYIAVTRALQHRLGVYKLTSPQWYFMREIWMQEGLSQRELSERVGTAESTTVSALRVLERRKLIHRVSRRGDRRASRVYLTETGKRLRKDVIPIITAVNALAIEGLSPSDVAALDRILGHIRANLWASMGEAEQIETHAKPIDAVVPKVARKQRVRDAVAR